MAVLLEVPVKKRRWTLVPLNAVLIRELDGPKGAMLSWLLLTTESIATYNDVLKIVRGYSYRWRIEEVHRVWKRGGCNVEDMQLRSREAILKWATIHCAVASRAVRLSRRSRTEPDIAATEEFSRSEIDALSALRGTKTRLRIGATPDLATMVRLVADAGGYAGKSSGPPGPTVIKRGLERNSPVEALVEGHALLVESLRLTAATKAVWNGADVHAQRITA
jgi:Transposase DDE domain